MDLKPEFPESLELSIQNPSRMLGETVSGSKAWCSAELSQEDWTIRLNEEAMKEFHIMAEKISNNPLPNLLRTHEEFEIPHLKETASSIRDVLDQGCGFCVMEQRPMETIPEPILAPYAGAGTATGPAPPAPAATPEEPRRQAPRSSQ